MEIRPISNEADHRATLAEISLLMESDPARGTPDGDRLEVLASLVEAYEASTFPL